jgi:hypothetical protein
MNKKKECVWLTVYKKMLEKNKMLVNFHFYYMSLQSFVQKQTTNNTL